MAWLRAVAGREAVRLVCRERRFYVLGDSVSHPAGGADHRLEARAGLEAIASLPPRQRAALALRVSGHSRAEIGAALGMTVRTVERQLGPTAETAASAEDGGPSGTNGKLVPKDAA